MHDIWKRMHSLTQTQSQAMLGRGASLAMLGRGASLATSA